MTHSDFCLFSWLLVFSVTDKIKAAINHMDIYLLHSTVNHLCCFHMCAFAQCVKSVCFTEWESVTSLKSLTYFLISLSWHLDIQIVWLSVFPPPKLIQWKCFSLWFSQHWTITFFSSTHVDRLIFLEKKVLVPLVTPLISLLSPLA